MTKKTMSNPRNAYGQKLVELGKKYSNLVVLDADLSKSTKTILFAKEFPDRFFYHRVHQFGVELGKTLATDIRKQMALKNQNNEHRFDGVDPITGFYLETLFSGK